MVFLNRRYQVSAILTILIVTVLYLLQLHFRLDTFPVLPSWSPSPHPTYIPEDDGRWHWRQLSQHFPLKTFVNLPTGIPKRLPKVQHSFPKELTPAEGKRLARQHAVKAVFERCWKAYKERAWLADELGPLSGGPRTTFGGWAATLVDSLDTLWIMGLKAEFEEAVNATNNIDFSPQSMGDSEINIFETTIRYLGGFLAAYDLSGDKRLLDRAVEVGDMVYAAFDTPNRFPRTRWKPSESFGGFKIQAHDSTLLAEIGSMCLEFTRLSQVTGSPKWFDATERITYWLDGQQDKTQLPGMFPIVVNAREKDAKGFSAFSLGSMSDSTYEYFIKMYLLLGGLAPVYRKLFEYSMNTAVQYTLFRPLVPDNADILIAGKAHVAQGEAAQGAVAPTLEPATQHLACFGGGAFALGGKALNVKPLLDIGAKLTDGCIWTYANSPSGIMPEQFVMAPCASVTNCSWNETVYLDGVKEFMAGTINDSEAVRRYIVDERLAPGFTAIKDRRYSLRPEAIESVFILYRTTGREDLPDTAWRMFEAIDKATRTELANAEISDTTVRENWPKRDSMESFWMAETLKYFYLIFSEPNLISLDEWIFNTEAHPFRRPRGGKGGWG